jgi:hypothetical protein
VIVSVLRTKGPLSNAACAVRACKAEEQQAAGAEHASKAQQEASEAHANLRAVEKELQGLAAQQAALEACALHQRFHIAALGSGCALDCPSARGHPVRIAAVTAGEGWKHSVHVCELGAMPGHAQRI